MRKKGKRSLTIKVDSPSRGLITRIGSNIADAENKRAVAFAQNVRFDDANIRNAPGYESINLLTELDSAPNLIFQAEISNDSGFISSPIIGTTNSVYAISREGSSIPQVSAGDDNVVYDEDNVGLSGSFYQPSSDTTTYTFQWVMLSGTGDSTIDNETTLTPTVTVTEAGSYIFQLIATNGVITVSDNVTIQFLVSSSLTVNAGADFDSAPGTIGLTGSVSPTLFASYVWIQISGPVTVDIVDSTTLTPSFSTSTVGNYTFRLSATNGTSSGDDFVNVSVKYYPCAYPQTVDQFISTYGFIQTNSGSTPFAWNGTDLSQLEVSTEWWSVGTSTIIGYDGYGSDETPYGIIMIDSITRKDFKLIYQYSVSTPINPQNLTNGLIVSKTPTLSYPPEDMETIFHFGNLSNDDSGTVVMRYGLSTTCSNLNTLVASGLSPAWTTDNWITRTITKSGTTIRLQETDGASYSYDTGVLTNVGLQYVGGYIGIRLISTSGNVIAKIKGITLTNS